MIEVYTVRIAFLTFFYDCYNIGRIARIIFYPFRMCEDSSHCCIRAQDSLRIWWTRCVTSAEGQIQSDRSWTRSHMLLLALLETPAGMFLLFLFGVCRVLSVFLRSSDVLRLCGTGSCAAGSVWQSVTLLVPGILKHIST